MDDLWIELPGCMQLVMRRVLFNETPFIKTHIQSSSLVSLWGMYEWVIHIVGFTKKKQNFTLLIY